MPDTPLMRAVTWFIVTVREAGYTAIVILLVVLLWRKVTKE
jgi:hypothetical protein